MRHQRAFLLAVLVLSSFAAACASVTAPTSHDGPCESGYISSNGQCVPDGGHGN